MANEFVYPLTWIEEDNYNRWQRRQHGLTKREYFAAMAMQGLLASSALDPNESPETIAQLGLKTVSEASIEYADKLIAALAAPPEDKDRG